MSRRSKRAREDGSNVVPERSIGGVSVKYLQLMKDTKIKNEDQPRKLKRPLRFRKMEQAIKISSDEEESQEEDDWEQVEIEKKLVDHQEEDEESDDEDEFEAVDVSGSKAPDPRSFLDFETEEEAKQKEDQANLVVQFDEKKAVPKKRSIKVLTSEEKRERLSMHKLHLICLLRHVAIRNRWCNDHTIRKHYKRLLPSSVLQELHPPSHLSNTLKTRKFLDGLRHAGMFWVNRFSVVNRSSRHGLLTVPWDQIYNKKRSVDSVVSQEKFKNNYLLRFKGNRDVAAQGFCALLRAANVDCRLVCSLQPVDFTSNVPMEPVGALSEDVETSKFPVFWVEAWDKYGKNWVSADPLSLQVDIIRRISKFEPPLNDKYNILRYVIAFNYDGSALDVTRRYANHYNAKTRKKRVTNTPGGAEWWMKALKPYKSPGGTQREMQEERELARREATEDMPSSIEDFKGHPLFVLEQHLKQTEVLDPKVSCGKLSIRGGVVEIFRRKDVKSLKSQQTWYRLGRAIKPGAQALKLQMPPAKKRKRRNFSDDDDDEEGDAGVPLYGEEQTELYTPPPVESGKVPKNRFGNIDVYTESMVPKGARHLAYPHIDVAAKLIGVDYADAVSGFDFHGRQMARPRINGIVVAEEYVEAIMEVYMYILDEQREEDEKLARQKALYRWRRYLIALRIKDRLNKQHGVVNAEEPKPTSEPEVQVYEKISSSDENYSASPINRMSLPPDSPVADEPDLPVSQNHGTPINISSDDSDKELLKAQYESLKTSNSMTGENPKKDADIINLSDESGEFMADSMSESEL